MKTLVLESLFNKHAGLQACNFIKNRLQHRCFPVDIAKFLRTTYFEEHLQTAASAPFENCQKLHELINFLKLSLTTPFPFLFVCSLPENKSILL